SLSTNSIILIGVIFSMFASSVINLIISFAQEHIKSITFWTMGSLSGTNFGHSHILAAAVLVCGFIILRYARELNAFAIGEDNARHIGVNVKKVKLIVLITVSVLLFESAAVTQNEGGSTTIKFKLKPQAVLWGHTVKYDNGVIEIICKYPPQLTGNPDLPLEGITVALDAGHGIDDPGALGVAKSYGPTEAQINRATALAVKKKLESMGATVSLLDELEHGNSFNNRMQPALDLQADFFISLHCNSTVENYNGTAANGAEVYYYETGSKQFAKDMVDSLAQNTGRRNRGNLFYEFRVILNSLAPSVLVEMGYMSNPADYDDLCSKEGIYNTAVAVSDAIINHLTPI
ncbi:MAG: N-acetylmuramoyl-L-alanine amidase, partial [Oscillospiraceae bacterium]|nr:N-acetylmuramoyl-L-alanine amidase [Oscillospiraceae bacterium]